MITKRMMVCLVLLLGTTSAGAQGQSAQNGHDLTRVAGNVQAAKLIKQVPPVYPEIAKKAGVSGMVMLHAVIGKDGSVEQVGFVFGSLLLLKSTVDAVRQWTYQPTVLQGEPVEVDTTITVVYRLSGLSGTVLDGSEQQSQEVPQRVRVAEKAMGARMIKKGKPKYPKEAKKAGIGGTVVLHVVVAEDGNIEEVHYVSGPGELSQAAIDAVQEWCYQPIVLNGKPVQADTTIDIVFSP